MTALRVVAGFAARFLVVILVISVAYRWIGPAYLAGFRTAANLTIPGMGANCRTVFGMLPEDSEYHDRYHDTKLLLTNTETRLTRTKILGVRVTSYVPTAMLIALVLATPISWRRRVRALGWGLLIIHAVILIRVAVIVLYVVSRDEKLGTMNLGPAADYIVLSLFNALARSTLSSYVIATIIWIGVCMRKTEWQALTHRLDPAAP